jgi:UDP-glucose 4-epimerase
MSNGTVLVTGGAGFIGSHTTLELLTHGHDVVVVDNFSNSSPRVLDAVGRLAGRKVTHYDIDLCDRPALNGLFDTHRFDSVIHFAALKAPRESVEKPIEYYDNNLGGMINLLAAMQAFEVTKIVFSSSCSIYGAADVVPIDESVSPNPTNPYARSKLIGEQMLADACIRHPEWSALALRYFNPTGAHDSGDLGEDPLGIPINLMPVVAQVAVGRLEILSVFGNDYPTRDGTGVRDYIHVVDLADAHRVALDRLSELDGFQVVNIGTGVGSSVLELVSMFEQESGVEIPYRIVDRMPGDVAALVASADRAASVLGWTAQRDLAAMCRDAWNFQSRHPRGIST